MKSISAHLRWWTAQLLIKCLLEIWEHR